MDQAPSHKNEDIISFLYINNVEYLFIPIGLTSKLQPLDLTFIRVFKNSYKKNMQIILYLIQKISLMELKIQVGKIF